MQTGHELAGETLAVLLAGGRGTRLGSLTDTVCKPALPFGAAYRNVDFSLSNCVNSGIRRIGIAVQHNPEVLLSHIDKVWRRLSFRPGEFIVSWSAHERDPAGGYRGTADAVYRNLEAMESAGCRDVLVLAGDHVYKMDYRPLLSFHRRQRADVTVGYIEVPVAEARHFGILAVDGDCRIRQFLEKPATCEGLTVANGRVYASMGIYVFDSIFLARILRRDAFTSDSGHDFGADILPSILRDARVFAYRFSRGGGNSAPYWRDVGTPIAYWRAHMDLLGSSARFALDDPGWPLRSDGEAPINTARDARLGHRLVNSIVSRSCRINGAVRASVVSSNAVVAQGAIVEESVILPGARIGRDCRLRGVIVDSGYEVPDGTVVERTVGRTAAVAGREPVILTASETASETVESLACGS